MATGGDTPEQHRQGWFADPFGIHEARWFSQGTPTALVRDGRTEDQDPPPESTWSGRLVPATVPPRTSPHPGPPAPERGGARGGPAPTAPVSGRTTAGRMTPVTPDRLVTYRWVALGLAVAWTGLVAALILSATTTSHSAAGKVTTSSQLSSNPAGVVLFIGFLLSCCAVTGVGLVRRIRADSEGSSSAGYAVAGILFVLGVLSLASIGLTLIVLALALWAVARPMRRPRPLPGERVA